MMPEHYKKYENVQLYIIKKSNLLKPNLKPKDLLVDLDPVKLELLVSKT